MGSYLQSNNELKTIQMSKLLFLLISSKYHSSTKEDNLAFAIKIYLLFCKTISGLDN